VHVAVAKEREMRIHAFRRKGGGEHIVKALLDHADAVSSTDLCLLLRSGEPELLSLCRATRAHLPCAGYL
jgi:hypothetical protein